MPKPNLMAMPVAATFNDIQTQICMVADAKVMDVSKSNISKSPGSASDLTKKMWAAKVVHDFLNQIFIPNIRVSKSTLKDSKKILDDTDNLLLKFNNIKKGENDSEELIKLVFSIKKQLTTISTALSFSIDTVESFYSESAPNFSLQQIKTKLNAVQG